TCYFNCNRADGSLYIPSRSGRTVGQVVADVLGMARNSTSLAAHGLGGYTSGGSGATATCSVSGGAVGAAVVTAAGTGYPAAPAVLFWGGGGSGAAGTATVLSGGVTAIAITAGGSGYRSAPTVILSRLPLATLQDLDTLAVIPPQRCTIAGERI